MTVRADLLPILGQVEPRTRPARWETRAGESSHDEVILTGYASVVDSPYDMYGGPEEGGWSEVVDPKAFDKTLRSKPAVHFLVNHGGLPLASTVNKTLSLSVDGQGLAAEARLKRKYPTAQEIADMVADGLLSEMSFAFRTIRDKWFDEKGDEVEWGTGSVRRLTELSIDKGDVSVVNFGANPATSIGVRAAVDILAQASEDALAEVRSSGYDIAAVGRRLIARKPTGSNYRALLGMDAAEALKTLG